MASSCPYIKNHEENTTAVADVKKLRISLLLMILMEEVQSQLHVGGNTYYNNIPGGHV